MINGENERTVNLPIFSLTLVCFSLICFSSRFNPAAYGAAPYVFSTWISLVTLYQPPSPRVLVGIQLMHVLIRKRRYLLFRFLVICKLLLIFFPVLPSCARHLERRGSWSVCSLLCDGRLRCTELSGRTVTARKSEYLEGGWQESLWVRKYSMLQVLLIL